MGEKKRSTGKNSTLASRAAKNHLKGKSGFLSDAMLFKGNVRKKLPASLSVGEHHGISLAVGLLIG